MFNATSADAVTTSMDSKYTVADILSSMANGEPAPSYSGDNSATTTFGTRTPTTPTLTLTPTTLASIEQTFIELQSVPVTSAAQDLSRQSGFVPPIVEPVAKSEPSYSEYYDTDSTDGEWMPSPAKKPRADSMPSVINYVGSAVVTSSSTPGRKQGGRKRRDDKLTPEEEEKRRVRRERNKLAAAKCRQRRVDQTNTLITQTEGLEEEKASLENEIQTLQQQKEQLEFLLEAHRPMCKSAKLAAAAVKVKVEKEPEQVPHPLVIVTSAAGSKTLPESLVATSRPNSLPLPSRTSATEATGVLISTPSSGVFATLGLDSMVDGHTGLTPIMGGPSCSSEVQRSSSDSGSTSDALGSPTLMAL